MNLEINNKDSSCLLYLHKRKKNSLVRKTASETKNKNTTVFNAKNDSSISLANKVIAKRDNSYANQTILSNAALHPRGYMQ